MKWNNLVKWFFNMEELVAGKRQDPSKPVICQMSGPLRMALFMDKQECSIICAECNGIDKIRIKSYAFCATHNKYELVRIRCVSTETGEYIKCDCFEEPFKCLEITATAFDDPIFDEDRGCTHVKNRYTEED